MPTHSFVGRISASLSGEVIYEGPADATPATPLSLNLSLAGKRDGVVEVRVVDAEGRVVIQGRG